jgi:PAS domain S-box-containing protein
MDSLAVPDDIGEYTSCLSAVADITEQRIAESNLERSRTEFKTLAENLPDIVIRFDERLRVLFMTPSVESVTGLHHGQYIGRSPREIGLPPELAAEWEKLLERVFKSGSEEEFEFCLDGLKGKMFYSARVVPERINGAIKSVLFVARDLSDRRRMEKELMAAKTSAEDANKAKSEFLANMSHEIRTPISGILGVTEMIISRSRDPEQEKYLRMVKESATLLMGVVNDILDFSKIEARKLDLEEHEFSPREMLEKILEPFRLQAKSKKLNLELTVDENVPEEVYGDARRIGQVIMNLVSNALKFTEEGGVSVSAGKPEGGSDRGMLQFSVRDTGIGIPLEQQKRLFQSFTQLDSSTSKKFQGTGLGLAICRQLVELMGGSIWVESKNGAGSAFHFTVALGKAELRPERQEAEEKAGKTRDFSGLRVLLAEDNILNQTFVVHFLQRAGHSVEAVSDGNEALRALDEKDFDIVLMDVQMPRLDGVEATSRIRSSGKPYSDVPIVALTAYAMSGDRERFIQAGMNDYVTKPIDMDRLLGIIHNSVNKESPSN